MPKKIRPERLEELRKAFKDHMLIPSVFPYWIMQELFDHIDNLTKELDKLKKK